MLENVTHWNKAIFDRTSERSSIPGIVWQPRLEFWYYVNKKKGALPEHLKNASLLDVYDYCYASIRYFTRPLKQNYSDTIQFSESWESENALRQTWQTPKGPLTQVIYFDEWQYSSNYKEHRIKTVDDLERYTYLLKEEQWYWDESEYQTDCKQVGNRGLPQFYFRRSPIQHLIICEMGFEGFVFMNYEHPDKISHYAEIAAEADDALYRILCESPVPLVNLGENIDGIINPPPIWNEILVPYYQKRVTQLHNAGKYVYIHVDGAMKPLLPYLNTCDFDGIEAATPTPQGDVTLEEIKEALGDMVLLDGIPAVLFLPSYSEETLLSCASSIVSMFHPRLILGISDEIPPNGDIEKVRRVGEWVMEQNETRNG